MLGTTSVFSRRSEVLIVPVTAYTVDHRRPYNPSGYVLSISGPNPALSVYTLLIPPDPIPTYADPFIRILVPVFVM